MLLPAPNPNLLRVAKDATAARPSYGVLHLTWQLPVLTNSDTLTSLQCALSEADS